MLTQKHQRIPDAHGDLLLRTAQLHGARLEDHISGDPHDGGDHGAGHPADGWFGVLGLHGHAADDTATRRAAAPWYRSKTEPSILDMLIKLRRHIIAARFLPSSPRPATTQEILEVQQAWAEAAA